MKKTLFAKMGMMGLALLIGLLTPGCGICGFGPGQVFIRDPQLELALRKELGIPFSCITKADMLRLTDLNAASFGIQFLDGLEEASNLKNLDLKANFIENINPIRGLKKLVQLNVGFNGINVIEPISGLTSLRVIDLTCNSDIFDWDPLVAVVTTNNGFLEGGTIYVDEQAVVVTYTDAQGNTFDGFTERFSKAYAEIQSYAQANNVIIEVIIGSASDGSTAVCGF